MFVEIKNWNFCHLTVFSLTPWKILHTYSAFQWKDLQLEKAGNCFSSKRWCIYSLLCGCIEGEKTANVSWAKRFDWGSKEPLAVPLKVTKAGTTPPGAFLQKGMNKSAVFCSFTPHDASLTSLTPFQGIEWFLQWRIKHSCLQLTAPGTEWRNKYLEHYRNLHPLSGLKSIWLPPDGWRWVFCRCKSTPEEPEVLSGNQWLVWRCVCGDRTESLFQGRRSSWFLITPIVSTCLAVVTWTTPTMRWSSQENPVPGLSVAELTPHSSGLHV